MNSWMPCACTSRPIPKTRFWLLTNFPNWG